MDENKILNNPEEEIDTEETEIHEEDSNSELPEEQEDEISEETDETEPEYEIYDEGYIEEEFEVKKSKKGIIIAAVLIAVVVLIGIFAAVKFLMPKDNGYTMMEIYLENLKADKLGIEIDAKKYEGVNKYNNMGYANVSGMTLGQFCEEKDYDLEEFKESYGLPDDMPADTYFDAAQNMMPVGTVAAMNYTDFATLKKNLNIPDTIDYYPKPEGVTENIKSLFSSEKVIKVKVTEEMPLGIIYDEMTLEALFGADKFETLKTEYKFGDEITPQTKYKDVRQKMEEIDIENRIKEEEAENLDNAEFEGDEGIENITGEVTEENQPAESEAAEGTQPLQESEQALQQ